MKKYESFIVFCLAFISLIFFVYILYIGALLIIPFIIAVLLSFIILSISWFYRRVFLLPAYISFLFSLITIGLVFYIIGQIINTNIDSIIRLAPLYQEKFIRIITTYAETYNIETNIASEQFFSNISFSDIFSSVASIVTSFVRSAGTILFFTLFILLESKSFTRKLALITWGEKSTFFQALYQIQSDIKSYFVVKTIISLATGFISWLILFFFWIDFFMFWAFLIFVLNYIPNIGSIIAVFFPVTFSLVQFESLSLTFTLLIILTWVQILFWNVIEPKLMGNRLNLSPLVILISLIFWGSLWGPIGMLLSVPLMVMINITLAHIESTRLIAVLLSEKWIIKYSWLESAKKWKFWLKKMKKILEKIH